MFASPSKLAYSPSKPPEKTLRQSTIEDASQTDDTDTERVKTLENQLTDLILKAHQGLKDCDVPRGTMWWNLVIGRSTDKITDETWALYGAELIGAALANREERIRWEATATRLEEGIEQRNVDETVTSLGLPEPPVDPKRTQKRPRLNIRIVYWCSILLLLATTLTTFRPNGWNPLQATFSVVNKLKFTPSQDHLAAYINDTNKPVVLANRTKRPLHYSVNQIIDEEADAVCPLHNPTTTLYKQEHQVCLLRKHPLVQRNVYSFASVLDFTIDWPSMPSQWNPLFPTIKDSIPKQYHRIVKMVSTEAISVLLIIASFVAPGIEMPLWVRQTLWLAPRAVMVQAAVFRLIWGFRAFYYA